jgi:hypothetical protein
MTPSTVTLTSTILGTAMTTGKMMAIAAAVAHRAHW